MKNLFDIDKKIVIITGGLGFLGYQYAEYLIDQGCKVAVWDLPGKSYSEFKKGETTIGGVDVRNRQEIESALRLIERKWGIPDALINNAGIDYSPDKIPNGQEAILPTNLLGAVNCADAVGRKMCEKGRGSIVNIGSIYGLIAPDYRIYPKGFVKPIMYGAGKAGLINATKYLATLWAGMGVRVNCLIPGGIENGQPKKFIENYSFKVPMGRMGKAEELFGAIHFLISDASSYMTGANLIIDGGYGIW